MKKIIFSAILTIIVSGIFTVTTASAKGPALSAAVRDNISKSVAFPENLIDNAVETVEVLFTISEDGTVKVKKATSADQELADYVTREISKINMNAVQDPNSKYYRIVLTFQNS
jgi:hypothetical protein